MLFVSTIAQHSFSNSDKPICKLGPFEKNMQFGSKENKAFSLVSFHCIGSSLVSHHQGCRVPPGTCGGDLPGGGGAQVTSPMMWQCHFWRTQEVMTPHCHIWLTLWCSGENCIVKMASTTEFFPNARASSGCHQPDDVTFCVYQK